MAVAVLVLSDLHMEVPGADVFRPRTEGADLIVLAGDIHQGTKGLRWAARLVRKTGLPLVYVAGNHEYWRHRLDRLPQDLARLAERYRRKGLPLYYLEQDCTVVEAGGVSIRVIGATLWSDFALNGQTEQSAAMERAVAHMPDYRMIRTGWAPWHKLKPADTLAVCESTIRHMWDIVVHPFDGPTIIVTHTGPSFRSISSHYSTHILSPAFASDFEEVIRFGHVALWVHGHVHHSVDYSVFSTRVVANPRGYWPDRINPDFNSGLIVDLPTHDT